MEKFSTLLQAHRIIINVIVFTTLFASYFLIKRILFAKLKRTNTQDETNTSIINNNEHTENDILENYYDEDNSNTLGFLTADLPPDDIVEMTPLFREALEKQNAIKAVLSDTIIDGNIIHYKNTNISKLSLLNQTLEKALEKESIERINGLKIEI